MKKLLTAFGLLGLLWSITAQAVVSSTSVGNVAYTILNTDVRLITTTAFTAARTWTLPYAAATQIGQAQAASGPAATGALEIIDVASAFSVANPLTIAPQSGDTINGSTASVTINVAGARILLVPTSGTNWQLAVTNTQGAVIGTASTNFHGCGVVPIVVTAGTDTTAVNTETYITEIQVPYTATLTGVAFLNLATSTGNVQFSLADSSGKVITAAQTASTAAGTGAVWQQVAFASPYTAYGPAKYYVLMQNSGSNHYRSIPIGNCSAGKKTGETFGTFTNITPPTGFTANQGAVIDTY